MCLLSPSLLFGLLTNPVSLLPPSFGRKLSGNLFQRVPASIGQLQRLATLFVPRLFRFMARFRTILTCFFDFHVTIRTLQGNQLWELPSEIGRLNSLENLLVGFCALPCALSLTNLDFSHLDRNVADNQLLSLPLELAGLSTRLTNLYAPSCSRW